MSLRLPTSNQLRLAHVIGNPLAGNLMNEYITMVFHWQILFLITSFPICWASWINDDSFWKRCRPTYNFHFDNIDAPHPLGGGQSSVWDCDKLRSDIWDVQTTVRLRKKKVILVHSYECQDFTEWKKLVEPISRRRLMRGINIGSTSTRVGILSKFLQITKIKDGLWVTNRPEIIMLSIIKSNLIFFKACNAIMLFS